MQNKLKVVFAAVLTAVLLLCVWGPALAAEPATQEATTEADPLPEPAAETATAAPVLPLPVIPQTAEPQPVVTPAAATPQPATPQPTVALPAETAGTVNLHLYVYTAAGQPAAGYGVTMGSARAATNASGLADFSGLAVAQQAVTIAAPDGTACTGRLYMSRSSATGVTDQAMGGTYGVDVARGLADLYMLVIYEPDGALNIQSVSNTQPALPDPAPVQTAQPAQDTAAESVAAYQTKALSATFVDAEGKPIAGMQVGITAGDGTTAALTTDGAGTIQVPNAPYGRYSISTASQTVAVPSFMLTITPGLRTAVTQGSGQELEVTASTTAPHLYLRFTQTAGGFTLTDASDEPIGSDMTGLVIGIIVVVAVVIVVIVAVVHYSKRRQNSRSVRNAAGQAAAQRRINYDPSRPQAPAPQPEPRRTGGTNKFDDRSKM